MYHEVVRLCLRPLPTCGSPNQINYYQETWHRNIALPHFPQSVITISRTRELVMRERSKCHLVLSTEMKGSWKNM
jgi:hypothetical protein